MEVGWIRRIRVLDDRPLRLRRDLDRTGLGIANGVHDGIEVVRFDHERARSQFHH